MQDSIGQCRTVQDTVVQDMILLQDMLQDSAVPSNAGQWQTVQKGFQCANCVLVFQLLGPGRRALVQ